ncbi:MAG: aminotransferase class V-fold PLP-dependent enzyme [Acidobacteria bacterium]|nr:aminotransferase class V-fold PLP-dependent enzyme [Acidobacteriota bacterium]
MPVIPCQRHLFDIPGEVAYFNCASNSPQLRATTARLLEAGAAKGRPWERTPASYFEDAEAIRALASDLFGGDRDGYAVVPSASYGLATAARAVEPQLRRGDSVLVIAEEFPSNVFAWRRTVRETGATLVTVALREDGDWTRSVLDRIDRRVKVVSISTCHWTNGALIDLGPIAQACRDLGAILVVDATQSLGAMPFPLADVDPDFLVAAGYKWLLFPYGVSLFYASPRWRDARPLEETWQARENARDFARLVDYSDVYMPGARRFDVGEKCSALLPGAIAALEQIRSWGIGNIAETLGGINARIAAQLGACGFTLPDAAARCPHIVGASLPGAGTARILGELKARNVYVSQRGASLRFAPHLHVSDEDIERLHAALDHAAARA